MKLAMTVSLATLAFILIGASQAAAEPRELRVVGYADLNLATRAGQDALEGRIGAVVDQLCRVDRSERRLSMRKAQSDCARVSRADAQTQSAAAALQASKFAALKVEPIRAQPIEASLLSPRMLERAQDLNDGEADIQTILTQHRASSAESALLAG